MNKVDRYMDAITDLREGESLELRSRWNGAYYTLILIERRDGKYNYRKDKVGALNTLILNNTKILNGVDVYPVIYEQLKRLRNPYEIHRY
jgi:hypothetical protein